MNYDSLDMYVEALIQAAQIDVQRGIPKERIVSSLSRIVDKDIFSRFRDRF